MFARAVRPAARSLRLAAPRAAPAPIARARAVRYSTSQAGPNQGSSEYTGSTDGQQLLMVLAAGGALFASVSIVAEMRRTHTAPNPDSSGKAEEEIEEEDEKEDAGEGLPEEGPSASAVNDAKHFVHEVDLHLDALIDNAERALKGDYTPHPNSGMPPLGDDAKSQGAYNEETGEINWDCPCLGGMATGPCGEEFKSAFSCFVHSTQEPKGMDCIEQFKGMQDCFRKHPDVYGEEIADMDNEKPEYA